MRLNSALKLVISILFCEAAGIVGAVFTTLAIQSGPSIGSGQSWYANLAKPELAPPNWVFGPVWTTLYALMGISAWLVWRKLDSRFRGNDRKEDGSDKRGVGSDKGAGMTEIASSQAPRNNRKIKISLGIFIGQLVLNMFWSIIFFGLHSPGGAFVEIIFLWLAILATIIAFAKISKPAAWLLVPYILWVSFAAYLNFSIWQLNASGPGQVACTQEAKLCPDGSYVGRTGPKCEFAQCPGDNNGL